MKEERIKPEYKEFLKELPLNGPPLAIGSKDFIIEKIEVDEMI